MSFWFRLYVVAVSFLAADRIAIGIIRRDVRALRLGLAIVFASAYFALRAPRIDIEVRYPKTTTTHPKPKVNA